MIDAFYQLLQKQAAGVFHVTNPGAMRHRELIELYQELVDSEHSCEWIHNDELVGQGLAVKGRSNNLLDSSNLIAIGIVMRPVGEALRDTMEKFAAAMQDEANK